MKDNIPIYEWEILNANEIVENIIKGIEECRQRYVEYAMKKYCITKDDALRLLNEIEMWSKEL